MVANVLLSSQALKKDSVTEVTTDVIDDAITWCRVSAARNAWPAQAPKNNVIKVQIWVSFSQGKRWQYVAGFQATGGNAPENESAIKCNLPMGKERIVKVTVTALQPINTQISVELT